MCRAACAEGSAMVTTVMSSTIINWLSAMTTRLHQRRGSGARRVRREPVAVAASRVRGIAV